MGKTGRSVRKMNQMMETLDMSKRMNLEEMVHSNPMGAKMTNALDWVFIHFSLSMVYSNAVLSGKAWIPPK